MAKKNDELERELAQSYCNFCQSHDLKITKAIKVQCRKCGKTRLVTTKLK